MATAQRIEELRKSVNAVLNYDRGRLIRRSEWGSIAFDKADHDFGRIIDLANYYKTLPVNILTDSVVAQINSAFGDCNEIFTRIDQFNLDSGNPKGQRDDLVSAVQSRADTLFNTASPWVAFLAFQSGDVQRHIANLTATVNQAQGMIESAEKGFRVKANEIDQIVIKTREASAAAGAAVFTEDFRRQADHLARSARVWIWVTGAFAAATLFAAGLFYSYIKPEMGEIEAVQRIAAKLAILGILITITIWCGRVYKALMHQSSSYRFKALGLQTFQAFSAGSADLQTKDAVLLETTRSIFSNHQSGYIEETASGDTQIVEVLKSALPSSER